MHCTTVPPAALPVVPCNRRFSSKRIVHGCERIVDWSQVQVQSWQCWRPQVTELRMSFVVNRTKRCSTFSSTSIRLIPRRLWWLVIGRCACFYLLIVEMIADADAPSFRSPAVDTERPMARHWLDSDLSLLLRCRFNDISLIKKPVIRPRHQDGAHGGRAQKKSSRPW